MIGQRTFVFLQGPHGSFFCNLGRALESLGEWVVRINLNGGDRVDWPGAHEYRGRLESWPSFFDDFILEHDVTDVVLFGDSRPMHRAAHGVATMRGITVYVFEEGYLRPDFVTLERYGVNGNSLLPRYPEYYRQAAVDLPPFAMPPTIPGNFRHRVRVTARYGTASVLGKLRFRGFQTHRPDSLLREGIGWLCRLATRGRDRRETARALAMIGDRPYFALPLQLNSDYQLRVHSSFGDMRAALGYAIRSFARSAPVDALLVIKRHPLDPAIVDWRRLTRRMARESGVESRIVYLPSGDVTTVIASARAVVAVNSTVGTLALNAGVPVKVLGQAIYDIAGITDGAHLDQFWSSPTPPDAALYEAFRQVIIDRSLVEGNFLSDEGQALAIAGSLRRLRT